MPIKLERPHSSELEALKPPLLASLPLRSSLEHQQRLLHCWFLIFRVAMFSSKIARPALVAAAKRSRQPAVRTYATATGDTKPPIAVFGIDGTYANALVSRQASNFMSMAVLDHRRCGTR